MICNRENRTQRISISNGAICGHMHTTQYVLVICLFGVAQRDLNWYSIIFTIFTIKWLLLLWCIHRTSENNKISTCMCVRSVKLLYVAYICLKDVALFYRPMARLHIRTIMSESAIWTFAAFSGLVLCRCSVFLNGQLERELVAYRPLP